MTQALPGAIDAEEWWPSVPDVHRLLCYRDLGGDGVPILLLHSINAAPSAMEVRPLFNDLRGRHPVLAPDLPGFGRSSREDRSYSPQFYSKVIRSLLEQIGGPVHVLALSTTSEFAARAALEEPGLFTSLTVVSPTGLGLRTPPAGERSEKFLRFLRTPIVGATLYRLLRTGPSVRFFLNMAFNGSAPRELVDYARQTAAQPGAMYAPFHFLSGKLFTPNAVEELYKKLTVPSLLLYDVDPNVTFERLDELLKDNHHWQAQRIPGTRGLPHFEQPVPTLDALETFWSRV